MSIAWDDFSPSTALAGGLLIGGAASLLVLMNGRIAGISGIVAGLLKKPGSTGDWLWRAAFVLGLMAAPLLHALIQPLPLPYIEAGYGTLALAGLIVGLGTRYGAGCTSGHGVCGLSRLSPRSLAATACFMALGFVTVALLRHVL